VLSGGDGEVEEGGGGSICYQRESAVGAESPQPGAGAG